MNRCRTYPKVLCELPYTSLEVPPNFMSTVEASLIVRSLAPLLEDETPDRMYSGATEEA